MKDFLKLFKTIMDFKGLLFFRPVYYWENQRVWRWGRKSKGGKREKKKIWGKYTFLTVPNHKNCLVKHNLTLLKP